MDNRARRKIPVIRFNPEHQRLLWLHFSPSMVLLILGLYALPIWAAWEIISDDEDFNKYLIIKSIGDWGMLISMIAMCVIISRSLRDDIGSRFWDQLRMSSLSAWQMTWPRLFTAPLLAWFGLIIGTIVSAWGNMHSPTLVSGWEQEIQTSTNIMLGAVIGLIGDITLAAWLLINCLQQVRRPAEYNGTWAQVFLLSSLVGTWQISAFVMGVSFYLSDKFWDSDALMGTSTSIFPDVTSILIYFLGLSLLMCVVSVLGAWRAMANKLHLIPSNRYWLYTMLAYPFIVCVYSMLWSVTFSVKLLPLACVIVYGSVTLYSLATQHCSQQAAAIKNVGLDKRYMDIYNHWPLWRFFLPLTLIAMVIALLLSVGLNAAGAIVLMLLGAGYLLLYAGCKWLAERANTRFNAPTVSMLAFSILYIVFFFVVLSITDDWL